MVTVLIQTFGRAAPVVVRTLGLRTPGGEVPQQRHAPRMPTARLAFPVQALPADKVTVHAPHQPIEHVAGPVAFRMIVGHRPQVPFVAQIKRLLLNKAAR